MLKKQTHKPSFRGIFFIPREAGDEKKLKMKFCNRCDDEAEFKTFKRPNTKQLFYCRLCVNPILQDVILCDVNNIPLRYENGVFFAENTYTIRYTIQHQDVCVKITIDDDELSPTQPIKESCTVFVPGIHQKEGGYIPFLVRKGFKIQLDVYPCVFFKEEMVKRGQESIARRVVYVMKSL